MSLAFLILGCQTTTVRIGDRKVSCWSFGDAGCKIQCGPIRIEDETGKTIYYDTNNSCKTESRSGGLTENGAKAIIDSIVGFVPAVIKAIFPFI